MPAHAILGLASPTLAAQVQALTSQALKTWSLRWTIEAEVTTQCASGDTPADEPTAFESLCDAGEPAGARLHWPRALAATLQGALYGTSPGAPQRDNLAARSARHVADDLRRLLAQAWQVSEWSAATPATAPPHDPRWTAPVDIRVTVAGVHILASVPALRLRAPRPSKPASAIPGSSLLAAAGRLTAGITAIVGSAQVSIADIAALQCGDVLLLDTTLREAARLEIAGGPDSLRANLGRAGDRRAVQLVQSETRGSPVPHDPTRSADLPRDVELSQLDATGVGAPLLPPRLAAFAGVKASVEILAGRAEASVGELLALKEGSVLTLDRAVDAPFDVMLDGATIARGQLVAVGEQFGVRITEVCMPTK